MICPSCHALVPEGAICTCHWTGRRTYSAAPRFEPSRGGTILTLGILSLVLCSLLGPVAWSMGSTELKRIDAGQVDPTSRGNAQAGMICGIVATGLMALIVVVIVIAAAAGGDGARTH